VKTSVSLPKEITSLSQQSINKRGLEEFDKERKKGRPCHLIHRNKLLAHELERLAENSKVKDARKLTAIASVLMDLRCDHISKAVKVNRSTLSRWIKEFNEGGVPRLLRKEGIQDKRKVRIRSDISINIVRSSSKYFDGQSARRVNAIVMLMEGQKIADVAEALNVSKSAVGRWCQSFNNKGLRGIANDLDLKEEHKPANCFR